jgi:predicted helicase
MQHLLAKKNLALLVGRAGQVIDSGEWNLIFVSREPTEFNLYRRGGNNVFPLVLQEDDSVLSLSADSRPNFAPTFLNSIASALQLPKKGEYGLPAGLTAEDIFGYAYATFHSLNYRSRYAEFLKIDFPHLPLTTSLKLFSTLAQLGSRLTALHLLESPIINKPVTEFVGAKNTEVDKVTWSKDTVWIDKAQTTGFKGVQEKVWNFHIGGYQVCEKWLKDRKGRKLTKEDIEHYQKIVVAISETIRLMAEIDKVIDEHGGWPGAFQTKS